MVRLNHDPQILHFTHPHILELSILHHDEPQTQPGNTPPCSGCKQQASGYMYSCTPCNFTLHLKCTQYKQLITHPSHPKHNLTLLPTAAYQGGVFSCDACNHCGSGFSYNCHICNFDLHVHCAEMKISITHQMHPDHPLELTFDAPYETKGFACDVCGKIGTKQWLYRCSSCEFDVHLECAANIPREVIQTPTRPDQILQHHPSLPGASATNHSHLYVQASPNVVGQGINNNNNNNISGRPNHVMLHSASAGSLPGYNQYQHHPVTINNNGPPKRNSLVNAMVNGLVEGAAQQVAQNVVQSIMGGGNDGGAGVGGDSSSSILDVGSSIFSGVIGDLDTQN